eukprot:RCo016977
MREVCHSAYKRFSRSPTPPLLGNWVKVCSRALDFFFRVLIFFVLRFGLVFCRHKDTHTGRPFLWFPVLATFRAPVTFLKSDNFDSSLPATPLFAEPHHFPPSHRTGAGAALMGTFGGAIVVPALQK